MVQQNIALQWDAKDQDSDHTVFIVDDDVALRAALRGLFESIGLRVEEFACATDFVPQASGPSCLVLDVRLPGKSGLQFQAELAKANIHIPIVFMTGHGDIEMSVRAMKAGAVEFLTKPFREQEILDGVRAALDRDRIRRTAESQFAAVRARFETLTVREREVAGLVATGLMNKQVGAELGIAEVTVKLHRMQAMRKLGAKSLADLIQMTNRLRAPRPPAAPSHGARYSGGRPSAGAAEDYR